MRVIIIASGMLWLLGVGALAQTSKEDIEKQLDHERSGVITLEQLQKDLKTHHTGFGGIVVSFVLPKGWEPVEATVDPNTKKQYAEIGVYSLIAAAPTVDEDEAPDMVFELDIFEKSLLAGLPPEVPEEERNPVFQMQNFLNEQINFHLKGGLDLVTKNRDIKPKQYGTSPVRGATWFTHLKFEVPDGGGMLYTFTSLTDDKVWMVKFYVADGQTKNYSALIALILNNTFGLSEQDFQDAFEVSE